MVSGQVVIKNRTGLHARPASRFVMEAKKYDSHITVRNVALKRHSANAKSIFSVLLARIPCGATVEIRCDGTDEDKALSGLVDLVNSGLGA